MQENSQSHMVNIQYCMQMIVLLDIKDAFELMSQIN